MCNVVEHSENPDQKCLQHRGSEFEVCSCRNGTTAFTFRRIFSFSVVCVLMAMARAALTSFVRRLRTTSVLQDSFLVHEQCSGILVNKSFERAHKGLFFSFPSIGSCRLELPGVPGAGVEGLRWSVGGESKQEGFVGFIRAFGSRSFATQSTQLRRLAKQPVKRDGPRPSGRPIRDRAMAGVTFRNLPKREGLASHSKSDTAGSRKSWKPRSFTNSGKKVDRSNVIKPRSFQDFQLRRRGFEDTEAEADVPAKRKRRVMRLHPSDQTNKRIVDDSPIDSPPAQPKTAATSDDGVLDDASSSQNAQFRAIQPLPEILRHIDTHLLGRRRLWEWRKGGYHQKLKAPLDDVPHGSKEGRLPIQETVFKHKLTFVAAAKVSRSLPSLGLPEIAFAGRSNVGKSSLINALTRQWGVVRTSDKPGMTQSVNFFTLGSRLCLVDLPGYGFAYAKEEAKEAWDDLVKEYVTTRNNLKRVCLLVDSKWGLKPRDEELIHLMENAHTNYQVVLTKTDILSPLDLARRATQIQEALKRHRNFVLPVVMVSSQTGGGLPHLRKALINLAVSGNNPT